MNKETTPVTVPGEQREEIMEGEGNPAIVTGWKPMSEAQPLSAVTRPKPQGGDYRPHYAKREADAYMNYLEARNKQHLVMFGGHRDTFWECNGSCGISVREVEKWLRIMPISNTEEKNPDEESR